MFTRRNKGMIQNSVILALIICIGYGFYMYNLLQDKVKFMDNKVLHQRSQYEALSSQMQVSYEEKARLEEKIMKKLKTECEEQRQQKEELIQGMLVEHQDKYETLVVSSKKLETEKAKILKESKVLELQLDRAKRELEDLKAKRKESLQSFSKDINMAHDDLQKCEVQQGVIKKQQASLESELQNHRMDYTKVLTSLKMVPEDAVNFNHPALKDISDDTKYYITGLLGERREDLMQLAKKEDVEKQKEIIPQPQKNIAVKEQQQQPQQNEIVPQPTYGIAKETKSQLKETIHQKNPNSLNPNSPEEVPEENLRAKDLKKLPPITEKQVDENHGHEKSVLMQKEDGQSDRLNSHQDPANDMDRADAKMQEENQMNKVEQSKNVHDFRELDQVQQNLDEKQLNDDNGLHEIEPDDPSKDLGGPIGNDVVHDLGAKESDDDDGMHEMDQAMPPEEDGGNGNEEAQRDEGEKQGIADGVEIDAPGENGELQIEDDENDIHEAIVHDEEDEAPKANVQVVLPPAARVANEDLEVAVNAPPGQKNLDDDDQIQKRNQAGDYHGDVYEHENYDRDSVNEDINKANQRKSHNYYQNEEESEEEKENRVLRNSKRERFDKNFETLREARKMIPGGRNL